MTINYATKQMTAGIMSCNMVFSCCNNVFCALVECLFVVFIEIEFAKDNFTKYNNPYIKITSNSSLYLLLNSIHLDITPILLLRSIKSSITSLCSLLDKMIVLHQGLNATLLC